MESINEFATAFREARVQSGVSLEQLAAALMVSVEYLEKVEKGRGPTCNMRRELVFAASVMFGSDPTPLWQAWQRNSGQKGPVAMPLFDLKRALGRQLMIRWDKLSDDQVTQIMRVLLVPKPKKKK